MPVNSLTGRDYSGVNVLLLWLAAEERGFTSDRWLTYNRAQEAGGQVRKGETATLAVIYRDWTKQAEDSNGNKLFDADGKPQMETVPMLRQFPLFNVEQCDDLPDRYVALPPSPGRRRISLVSVRHNCSRSCRW